MGDYLVKEFARKKEKREKIKKRRRRKRERERNRIGKILIESARGVRMLTQCQDLQCKSDLNPCHRRDKGSYTVSSITHIITQMHLCIACLFLSLYQSHRQNVGVSFCTRRTGSSITCDASRRAPSRVLRTTMLVIKIN